MSQNQPNAPKAFRLKVLQNMELKFKTDLHLPRKIWHVTGVAFIAYLMSRLERADALFYLSLAVLFVLPFDILRLKRPDLNHRLVALFKPIMRIEELAKISGVSFLLVGCIVLTLIFPKEIAILVLLLLAFGDPASSTFGVLFGKDKIWGRKTLQGTLACFVVCTIVCAVFFLTHNLMINRIVLVSILGGLIGAVSELIQFKKLDDNFTFPIIAGFGFFALFTIFGGF